MSSFGILTKSSQPTSSDSGVFPTISACCTYAREPHHRVHLVGLVPALNLEPGRLYTSARRTAAFHTATHLPLVIRLAATLLPPAVALALALAIAKAGSAEAALGPRVASTGCHPSHQPPLSSSAQLEALRVCARALGTRSPPRRVTTSWTTRRIASASQARPHPHPAVCATPRRLSLVLCAVPSRHHKFSRPNLRHNLAKSPKHRDDS